MAHATGDSQSHFSAAPVLVAPPPALPAVGDGDAPHRRAGGRAARASDGDRVLDSGYDATEDDVLAVQVRQRIERDEELRSVAVGAAVRHREEALCRVLPHKGLVVEPAAVDRLAAAPVARRDVSSLQDLPGHHPVQLAALEVQRRPSEGLAPASLARAEAAKVLGCPRRDVGEELDLDEGRLLTAVHACRKDILTP